MKLDGKRISVVAAAAATYAAAVAAAAVAWRSVPRRAPPSKLAPCAALKKINFFDVLQSRETVSFYSANLMRL